MGRAPDARCTVVAAPILRDAVPKMTAATLQPAQRTVRKADADESGLTR